MSRPVTCPKCLRSTQAGDAASVTTCAQCGHPLDVAAAAPVNPWGVFAIGCQWVSIGLVIELVTLTLLLVLLVGHLHWSVFQRSAVVLSTRDGWNPLRIIEVVAFGLVLGSLLVSCGRTAQTWIPRSSGVFGPLLGAALLGWLQFFAILAGVLGLSDTFFADQRRMYRRDIHLAWGCVGVWVGLRWFAGLSAAIGLALVGAVMPSKQIRTRVSRVAIMGQVAGVGVTLLIVVVALTQTTTGRLLSDWSRAYGSAMTVGIAFALFLASALANLSLYTTARRAALAWKPSAEPLR